MAGIQVKKTSDFPKSTYEVSVVGDQNTIHKVKLTKNYYKKLTNEKISPDELIRESFEFLLNKEPNTAILSEFDLELIQEYFSDFEDEISSQFE